MKSTAIQGAASLFAAAPKMRQNLQDKVQEVDFSAVISQAGMQNQAGIQNQDFYQDKAKPETKDMNAAVKEPSAVKKTEQKEPDFEKAEKYQKAEETETRPEEKTETDAESQEIQKDKPRDFEEIPEETVLNTAEFLSKLKEAFSKELSITEEELIAALEKLGFTVADFVDPDTVNTCIRFLCGAQTVTELLVDEELYVTYSQIQSDILDLTSIYSPGNNLSLEELQMLMLKLEELQETAAAGLEEGMFINGELENLPVNAELNADLPVNAELNENLPKAAMVQELGEDAMAAGKNDAVKNPSENPVETVKAGQETAVPIAGKQTKAEPQGLKENTEEKTEIEVKPVSENLRQMEQNQNTAQQNLLGGHNQPEMPAEQPRVENAFQPETPFTAFADYDGSYESIIRQVAEQVRVRVTADASTMEMMLNPESLGKLSLSVELKQGMMTARFVAETEQVKEAIESQATMLREDLDKQGVKVEAIEVTVETHEFERNLEQGQQQSQAEEEARNAENERSRNRRNLNLDVLEEEEELTEAEDLAAKIMKENGNTMDYFA